MWHPLFRLAAHRVPGRGGKIGRNGCSSTGRTLFVRPYTSKNSLPAVNPLTYSDTPGRYASESDQVRWGTGCPERNASRSHALMLSC